MSKGGEVMVFYVRMWMYMKYIFMYHKSVVVAS